MTIYRMAADATVCFDIEAATEDEAHAKAEKSVQDAEGDLDELADLDEANVYFNQEPITIDGPYDIREPAWPGQTPERRQADGRNSWRKMALTPGAREEFVDWLLENGMIETLQGNEERFLDLAVRGYLRIDRALEAAYPKVSK